MTTDISTPETLTLDMVRRAAGRTWFDIDDEGAGINLSTRDSGDVGGEQAGQADIDEGRRLIGLLLAAFPAVDYSIELQVIDEWVHVFVRKAPWSEKERAERDHEKMLSELRVQMKQRVEDANQVALAGMAGYRDPFSFYLATGYWDDYMEFTAHFGERILYVSSYDGNCRYKFTNLLDASAALTLLVDEICASSPMWQKARRSVHVCEPMENYTYHHSTPKKLIEMVGHVDIRVHF